VLQVAKRKVNSVLVVVDQQKQSISFDLSTISHWFDISDNISTISPFVIDDNTPVTNAPPVFMLLLFLSPHDNGYLPLSSISPVFSCLQCLIVWFAMFSLSYCKTVTEEREEIAFYSRRPLFWVKHLFCKLFSNLDSFFPLRCPVLHTSILTS